MNTNIDILIVEDSITQAENLKFILENKDYSVVHVFDGVEALEKLKNTSPKIIISDILMPEMDGFSLCAKVKSDKQLKVIPFILLTSLSNPGDIIKALECGADSFITKPFNEGFLLSKVQYLILNVELRRNQSTDKGLEILFGGKKHVITSDRMQIVDLLISTYESAVLKNNELQLSNNELQLSKNKLVHFNKNLELAVESRTEELELVNKKLLQEIEERELSEKKQELIAKILSILNRPNEWQKLIEDILFEVKKFSGIEAAAIRLQNEEDYPYFDTFGFSSDFIKTEKSLCIKENGNFKLDSNGKPELACFCGKVISGKTKKEQSFYTPNGSFWTNSTTKLLASKEVKEIKNTLRNRCNQNGYESMVLIPVVSGKETIGLIQLNDKRSDFFTPELITFFEEIASTIGIAYERVQYEKKITESLEFNSSLLKTIPFGMDIVDETGTILFQSENLKTIFGNDAKGKKCSELYRDNKTQCTDCPLHHTIEIGETKTIISNHVLGGRVFEIVHTGMMFKGKKALLEIFMDITERKIAEGELKSALEKAKEADRLKSSFLATMSHELRTPLNAVIGFSGLIDKNTSNKEALEYSEIIQSSGNELLEIIENMFSFSMIETGVIRIKKSHFQAKQILDEAFAQILLEKDKRNKSKIDIIIDSKKYDNNLMLESDKAKILQVLNHLLSNALKFTEEGKIEFGYSKIEQKEKLFLEFYVKDSGIGIPKDKQEIIFEIFRQVDDSNTRKYGGTGLGLALSKKLIDLMGGSIRVDSEPGKGSVFYFAIPFKEIIHKPKVSVPKEIETGKTILIVEDDDVNFELLSIYLKQLNCNILWSERGNEAIEICKTTPEIDLVLMDINLPKMNGIEAMKMIKKDRPNLPIIMQSAYVMERDKQASKAAGCDGFIEKPIQKKELYNAITKYLS